MRERDGRAQMGKDAAQLAKRIKIIISSVWMLDL
jgi:hypothetical protein